MQDLFLGCVAWRQDEEMYCPVRPDLHGCPGCLVGGWGAAIFFLGMGLVALVVPARVVAIFGGRAETPESRSEVSEPSSSRVHLHRGGGYVRYLVAGGTRWGDHDQGSGTAWCTCLLLPLVGCGTTQCTLGARGVWWLWRGLCCAHCLRPLFHTGKADQMSLARINHDEGGGRERGV